MVCVSQEYETDPEFYRLNFSCTIEESETQATSRLYMGVGLVLAGLILGFLGMQLRNPRAISGSWALALAVASMGATSLS